MNLKEGDIVDVLRQTSPMYMSFKVRLHLRILHAISY
jgi:hypothetical protein